MSKKKDFQDYGKKLEKMIKKNKVHLQYIKQYQKIIPAKNFLESLLKLKNNIEVKKRTQTFLARINEKTKKGKGILIRHERIKGKKIKKKAKNFLKKIKKNMLKLKKKKNKERNKIIAKEKKIKKIKKRLRGNSKKKKKKKNNKNFFDMPDKNDPGTRC